MDIFKKIRQALNAEYNAGATHQELADRGGISRVHVGRLLNDPKRFEKLELATFFKLFPKATVNLSGDSELTMTTAPVEPFLKIVQDNWSQLPIEDRAKIAGQVAAMATDKSKKTKTAG